MKKTKFDYLKEIAEAANMPSEVSEAINQISMAWVEGQISDEENHALVFSMYKRLWNVKEV